MKPTRLVEVKEGPMARAKKARTVKKARKAKKAPKRKAAARSRSAKAGRPPVAQPASPRAKRRQKTASAPVRKDTMLLQPGEVPEVMQDLIRPNLDKR
jgi:hypothetical protein